jgi:hypothetical protein
MRTIWAVLQGLMLMLVMIISEAMAPDQERDDCDESLLWPLRNRSVRNRQPRKLSTTKRIEKSDYLWSLLLIMTMIETKRDFVFFAGILWYTKTFVEKLGLFLWSWSL